MDLRVFAVSFLLQLFNTAFVSANVDPSCTGTVRGRSCTLPSVPEHTALIGDRLFVGGSNELLAFEVSNLEFTDRVDLSPTESELRTCIEALFATESCQNFIRVIEPVPPNITTHPQCGDLSDKILVCGTRAYSPKCRFHTRTNLSDSCLMTPENQEDQGFSPYLNERRNAGVLASNGRFYSGTIFTSIETHRTIGMAPRPLEGDGAFTVQTPDLPWWLRDPEFISTYEIGDRIYFFLREPAYEIDMGRSVVYSRAVRFCKDDPGMDGSLSNVDIFRTLQKARMTCTNSGSANSLPYDYDNLKATFLFAPEGENGERILYGAFSSPDNAPRGAAICKFSFDNELPGSLGAVFEDGQYFAPIFTTPGSSDGSDYELQNEEVFSCPGTQREPVDANAHHLVFNPATPLDPQPIHVISGSEYTQIAVDKFTYNGGEYEILYFGLNTGIIGQFVSGPSGTYEYQIDNVGNSVRDLLIHKDDSTGSRYLYATTNDKVISLVLGDCSRYTDCFKCFDSRDPYCAWNPDPESNTCVNLLTVNDSLPDSVSSTEDVIVAVCGNRPPMPTPEPTRPPSTCPFGFVPQSSQPQPSSTPQSTPENEGSSGRMPTMPEQPSDNSSSTDQPSTTGTSTDTPTVATAGVEGSSTGSDFSILELALASLGGVVFGIPIGLVICAVFFKIFIKKKGSDESRTTATHVESGTTAVNHVNNQLDQHVQKKQEQINQQDHRYVESTKLGTPWHHMQKNVNEYEAEEDDDDVLTELPPNGMFNAMQQCTDQSRTAPRVPHKPPASSRTRNRTESTRHLFSSQSSEPSESSGSSPLDSPA